MQLGRVEIFSQQGGKQKCKCNKNKKNDKGGYKSVAAAVEAALDKQEKAQKKQESLEKEVEAYIILIAQKAVANLPPSKPTHCYFAFCSNL